MILNVFFVTDYRYRDKLKKCWWDEKKLLKFYAEKIVIAFNFVKRINHYMYYHDVGQPNHLFSKTVHLVIGNGNE